MARRYDYDDLVNRLFDALADAPKGWTIHEISSYLEIPRRVADNIIRALRVSLGDSDEINVVYRVDGKQRRYLLVGNFEDAKERLDIRLATYLANFETEMGILRSIVAVVRVVRRAWSSSTSPGSGKTSPSWSPRLNRLLMPRHGNTRRSTHRKGGHRMHRRSRPARLKAKTGRGRKGTAWGRGGGL